MTIESSADNAFLGRLTERDRSDLLELGRVVRYPRGAGLMYEGESGDRVMILLEGRVKITRLDLSGHETLLSIRDPGDILGELSSIDGGTRLGSVVALEPGRAAVIASSAFRCHLETRPRVALALLEVTTWRIREATLMRSQFSSLDTLGRLAARLIELAERYGTNTSDGVEVALPISQEELAEWTGASRAGVAKALQTMRELRWLATTRRRIVVRDLTAIRNRAA
jgi:CRP-like cAMP-binding protein